MIISVFWMLNSNVQGNSLVVQWLKLWTSNDAGGTGLIPGQGTKIPHATHCSLKKKNIFLSNAQLAIGL